MSVTASVSIKKAYAIVRVEATTVSSRDRNFNIDCSICMKHLEMFNRNVLLQVSSLCWKRSRMRWLFLRGLFGVLSVDLPNMPKRSRRRDSSNSRRCASSLRTACASLICCRSPREPPKERGSIRDL